jgi:hypothetical protein
MCVGAGYFLESNNISDDARNPPPLMRYIMWWCSLTRNYSHLLLQKEALLILLFISFAYQGKDIVFRFIIEYSSLRDFGP